MQIVLLSGHGTSKVIVYSWTSLVYTWTSLVQGMFFKEVVSYLNIFRTCVSLNFWHVDGYITYMMIKIFIPYIKYVCCLIDSIRIPMIMQTLLLCISRLSCLITAWSYILWKWFKLIKWINKWMEWCCCEQFGSVHCQVYIVIAVLLNFSDLTGAGFVLDLLKS